MMKGDFSIRWAVLSILVGGMVLLSVASIARAQEASPWKDRAEYDAFTAITQAKDPNQIISLSDKYLADYPETKFPDKVLEMKLGAYQATNNAPKMQETADKLLAISPNNLRALILLTYMFPRSANPQAGDFEAQLNKAGEIAEKCLAAVEAMQAPQGVAPDAFEKQKAQSAAICYQTRGFVALQKKEYEKAQADLKKSGEANQNDALNFYWLGLAYLSPKPSNYDQGIWALARAVSLSGPGSLPEATKTTVKDYLTKVYDARHGDTEGLDAVLAQAATSAFPAADFHVKSMEELAPPPEPEPEPVKPRELSVKPEDLETFDDIKKHLQAGGEKEADTWTLLKGASLPLPGRVVSATPPAAPKTLLLAVSADVATQEGKHDLEVVLAAPGRAVKKGEDITIEGTIDSYTARPFVLKIAGAKITK
jgi:tetratricopeptide (TPR) repeat protein